jgi:hypothetical protein
MSCTSSGRRLAHDEGRTAHEDVLRRAGRTARVTGDRVVGEGPGRHADGGEPVEPGSRLLGLQRVEVRDVVVEEHQPRPPEEPGEQEPEVPLPAEIPVRIHLALVVVGRRQPGQCVGRPDVQVDDRPVGPRHAPGLGHRVVAAGGATAEDDHRRLERGGEVEGGAEVSRRAGGRDDDPVDPPQARRLVRLQQVGVGRVMDRRCGRTRTGVNMFRHALNRPSPGRSSQNLLVAHADRPSPALASDPFAVGPGALLLLLILGVVLLAAIGHVLALVLAVVRQALPVLGILALGLGVVVMVGMASVTAPATCRISPSRPRAVRRRIPPRPGRRPTRRLTGPLRRPDGRRRRPWRRSATRRRPTGEHCRGPHGR